MPVAFFIRILLLGKKKTFIQVSIVLREVNDNQYVGGVNDTFNSQHEQLGKTPNKRMAVLEIPSARYRVPTKLLRSKALVPLKDRTSGRIRVFIKGHFIERLHPSRVTTELVLITFFMIRLPLLGYSKPIYSPFGVDRGECNTVGGSGGG